MKRKLLSLALVLAMALTLLPTSAFTAADYTRENSSEGTPVSAADANLVVKAKLHDTSGLVSDDALNGTAYTVSAAAASDSGADVDVTVGHTALVEHDGDSPYSGYLIGFQIKGPAKANSLKRAFGEVGGTATAVTSAALAAEQIGPGTEGTAEPHWSIFFDAQNFVDAADEDNNFILKK